MQKQLEQRLRDGLYPVGSLPPTEVESAAEFATSRFTVREALRHLTDGGFVERRQGVGTPVISSHPQVHYAQSIPNLQELFQVAVETRFVMMGQQDVVPDAELAETVGGGAGERWFHIDGVRLTEPGGRPLCFIQSFVPERFCEGVAGLGQMQGPFFARFEAASGLHIDVVEQDTRARHARGAAAAAGAGAGAQSLQLLRRYVTTEGVLICSINRHPADQLTYKMKILRSRSPA
ncbi:GntR family transcriptional regulator [Salipiger mangrovisoli]|uniref:GntR family transcriptional regulator n=1 Tax=Salipiger mangrovisoli TaxID=2865933 RepID=A0ABR9X051_9RHOB|nr:GntR family transcriptional regulator [Salipiger mangrovisoli]MBE9636914.1 GntR family transcriptional regulator [Salipiger mangrovisoli]